jgi:hypothetical protein
MKVLNCLKKRKDGLLKHKKQMEKKIRKEEDFNEEIRKTMRLKQAKKQKSRQLKNTRGAHGRVFLGWEIYGTCKDIWRRYGKDTGSP